MDISSATAGVAQDLLKGLAILSETTIRRHLQLIEKTENYIGNQQKGHNSLGDQQSLLTTEKRRTRRKFLAVDLSPTFLNTGTTDETFQQSGKQVQLVCIKVQARISLEPPLEYNQDQMSLTNQCSL